jgi:hypothetical protein
MLKIVTRVFDGKRIVAYDVTDGIKKTRLSKDNVVSLALENKIVNARVDSHYNLVGRGCKLSSIKSIQLKNKLNYITLYHGSKAIIKKPRFGVGNIKNDYGQGFYTTRSTRLAAEWAGKYGESDYVYVNEYRLYLDDLRIENIEGDLMLWIAVLAKSREMWKDRALLQIASVFIEKYYDKRLDSADIIVGWRADDNLFTVVLHYLQGLLSEEAVLSALHFGGLGLQYFIKTEKAFGKLEFQRAIKVRSKKYRELANNRESNAIVLYTKLLVKERDKRSRK